MPVLVWKDWDFSSRFEIEDCVYLQREGERVLCAPGSSGLAHIADAEHCRLHITEFHNLNVGQQCWGH